MAAIPCDLCDATFDTKQMRNDHILLSHGALPGAVEEAGEEGADDQDNTDDDKVINSPLTYYILYTIPRTG